MDRKVREALELVCELAEENALSPKEADTMELCWEAGRQNDALELVRAELLSEAA